MKAISLKCPNCNSSIDASCKFCAQCGAPITIDDDAQKLKYTYQKVDDARIREADVHESVRLKEIELELFKLHDEAKQKKINLFVRFIVFVLLLATFVGLLIANTQANDERSLFAFLVLIVIAISTPIMFRNKR